jgi:hypothetical protein
MRGGLGRRHLFGNFIILQFVPQKCFHNMPNMPARKRPKLGSIPIQFLYIIFENCFCEQRQLPQKEQLKR